MYSSFGTIIYDPLRTGMRKPKTDWWCILEIDDEISRYYRWLWHSRTGIELVKPAWPAHVTIINGVQPPRVELWRDGHGENVQFFYDGRVYTFLDYVVLDIRSSRLKELRRRLGLETSYPFHVTIGRDPRGRDCASAPTGHPTSGCRRRS